MSKDLIENKDLDTEKTDQAELSDEKIVEDGDEITQQFKILDQGNKKLKISSFLRNFKERLLSGIKDLNEMRKNTEFNRSNSPSACYGVRASEARTILGFRACPEVNTIYLFFKIFPTGIIGFVCSSWI